MEYSHDMENWRADIHKSIPLPAPSSIEESVGIKTAIILRTKRSSQDEEIMAMFDSRNFRKLIDLFQDKRRRIEVSIGTLGDIASNLHSSIQPESKKHQASILLHLITEKMKEKKFFIAR